MVQSPCMTDLAQTALAFARECMGWSEAEIPNGATSVFERHGRGRFNPTDLNAVMAAVHTWCQAHHCQWAVFGNSRHEKFEHLAFILPFDDYWEARCENAPDASHALMAACVEAARKLREAA